MSPPPDGKCSPARLSASENTQHGAPCAVLPVRGLRAKHSISGRGSCRDQLCDLGQVAPPLCAPQEAAAGFAGTRVIALLVGVDGWPLLLVAH